ncbi:unnamed protein product [Candidula unifasciata]|uniref:Estradiol 17-beta-dehydrogenase 11 n=1 Tax=Candidula unifasciata TaxID=100452 RepID=A0A8S3Z590_9EUPU|nr:unnamed protein product [Candidula unifasciata]
MSVVDGVVEAFRILLFLILGYISALISVFFPPPRKSIEGETVLITGAGHGIGREFALEIAKLGATVVLWDINKMIKEFLPPMIKKGQGHILNVISMAGFSGFSNLTDYCASKHAAKGFHESLIEELYLYGHHNIKVTGLCPMFVDTGLIKDFKVGLLTPNETALAGIDGMLRNYELVTVPSKMYYMTKIGSLFPRKTVQFLVRSSGLEVNSQYKKKN